MMSIEFYGLKEWTAIGADLFIILYAIYGIGKSIQEKRLAKRRLWEEIENGID